ncbi:PKD domain-containing protein [Flammeovirgaceae bacterium 311]|nr:PKD domain-containing protein [Flammeovirgaceae bacterium 311]
MSLALAAGICSCAGNSQSGSELDAATATPRVLVFSKTKGWVHSSIPYGIAAIQKLGQEHGFLVDTTKNAAYFHDDSLKNYQAVIFNITTGNVLNAHQQAAFERYIQAGGGYVGIHSAADTEYEWPWYNKLMGAHFSSHAHNPNVVKATVDVLDKNHPATKGLPDKWERIDEWYSYRSFYHGLNVLANLDENTYVGGSNGAVHPIAWYHEWDGGRAFYTGGGHTDESFSEPLFLDHILGGIQYAIGSGSLDYAKAYARTTPEENRFTKTVLVNDLAHPMELAIADDGRIFFTELRSGRLSMYNTRTEETELVHQFKVNTEGGTGLIGVTLDPDFKSNNHLYVYYAPPADKEPYPFRLSRFTLKADNRLDAGSEKVLLVVGVEKNSGAHHGGSLAWDREGNLYLSTGDSSSPFPSNGYAPLDERPGAEYYSLDAQRSSANTNSLAGKILRIHPEADGTYTIPEGNLFPAGTAKTRPEIYVMGTRNPYRIAINPKTSTLYWGEIGPDAGKDSIQGPKGYDEFNQAKKAGNWGWPYFIADNKAYAAWDFSTNTSKGKYNPDAPVNDSPNNTGLTHLPPAQKAMIWYPYDGSEEFPELGIGGRSAMAGQFYTYNENSASKNRFPEYYDGALFVFDWMRNWVMTVNLDGEENFLRNEAFMTLNGDFRRPIDLAFGDDGIMYMLEYGSVYGNDNDDARLVKIEYNTGNRPPIAKARIIDSVAVAKAEAKARLTSEREVPLMREAAGEAPLRVLFGSSGTTDLDDDDVISYQWFFDGKTVGSTEREPVYTYTRPGVYKAVLKVTDQHGASGTDTLMVKVGNAMPQMEITSPQNKSFFWENKPFAYTVKVTDKEDGKIDPARVKVHFTYYPNPATSAAEAGSALVSEAGGVMKSAGNQLIAGSDCKACHTLDQVSVGPSYTDVARRYKGQRDAVDLLAKKIIAGGGGNWGSYVMSAHPQVSVQDATEMVKYILSLAEPKEQKKALPLQGTLALNQHKKEEPKGRYVLTASYTDQGGKGVGLLTATEVVNLRSARVKTIHADFYKGFPRFKDRIDPGDHKSFVLLKDIDLTGIKKITYTYYAEKDAVIEARIGSQEGPAISSVSVKQSACEWGSPETITTSVSVPTTGRHNVYFVVLKPHKPSNKVAAIHEIYFEQ